MAKAAKAVALFSIDEQETKLVDVNPRKELHGEEDVLAADLRFEAKMLNDSLALFHPTLKWSMYDKDQGDLGDHAAADAAIKLRFPKMSSFCWENTINSATVTIHKGGNVKSDIVLKECKVDSWRLECLDGGTVIANFRVQVHPSEDMAGKLCMLTKKAVTISVEENEASAAKQAA